MNKNQISSRTRRTGAAFLLLVFLVLLVVLGATQTMVRSEMTTRRGELGRQRLRSMLIAIDAAQNLSGESTDPVRLPIDPAANEFIEVTVNQDASSVVARWLRGDQLIDEMKQNLVKKAESGE
jgi:hypothetical protein